MKIDDYNKVSSLMRELAQLDGCISLVSGPPPGLGVTIQGTYQDAGIVDAARPTVLGVLAIRKIEKLQELKKLGVDVSDVPAEPMTDWFRLDMLGSIASQGRLVIDFDASGDISVEVIRTGLPMERVEASDIREAIDKLAGKDL